MKTTWVFIFIGLISASAQDDRESIGAYGGGGYYAPPPQKSAWELQQEKIRMENDRINRIYNELNGQIYRVVNGKVYNVLKESLNGTWSSHSGNLYQSEDGVTIIENQTASYSSPYKYTALTNYFGRETDHEWVTAIAVSVGNYDDGGGRLFPLYDCGTPANAQQIAQIKAEEAVEQAQLNKQAEEAKQAAQAKLFFIWQKSFHTVALAATNGDASEQYNLGIRYLKGMGCETNQVNAIYWLQKSAMQGDLDASNKLNSLNVAHN